MRIAISTGYAELGNYWGDWLAGGQTGGTERMLMEFAKCWAADGHTVVARLPYKMDERAESGVLWVGQDAPQIEADLLLCWDDFAPVDKALRRVLFNGRSDPPRHTDFDEIIFFSKYQARVLGHPSRPAVGGGVTLADYAGPLPRVARRVICTTSADRCPKASAIGAGFDFIHTYRPVNGVGTEYGRADLIRIQRTAMVQIHPLDPIRPSEFFSMSILEALAAGTPVITTDADAMPELWGDCTMQIPLPVDLGVWTEAVDRLLIDRDKWRDLHDRGRRKAKETTWPLQAERFLKVALA